ncbi:EamA family transporter [Orbaceae bacterium ac157xtp]
MILLIFLLWLGSICCDTVGQIAFKFAAISPKNRDNFGFWYDLLRNYWLWIGFFSYAIGFFLWIAFLSLLPLSQAILLGSFNIISVMLVGRFLFKEHFTPYRIIGVALISVGIVLVGVS